MSQKGLTYFFILVFLICSGIVFSKPGVDTRLVAGTGSIVQPESGAIVLFFSAGVSTDSPNTLRILTESTSTPIEIIAGYSQKNHILSKRYYPDREKANRTRLWFNSKIRN